MNGFFRAEKERGRGRLGFVSWLNSATYKERLKN